MAKSSKLIWLLATLLAGASMVIYSARHDIKPMLTRILAGEGKWFAKQPLPVHSIPHLFDLGIVDANGDGWLDIFTSNHNYRQVLLLADGKGGHRDVLTEWGLDQNRDYPGWEQSFIPPRIDEPGLYIYWLGDTLTLQTRGIGDIGPVAGTLKMFSPIEIQSNNGFKLRTTKSKVPDSPIEQTTVEFYAKGDGTLKLMPLSRGVPTEIEVSSDYPLFRVFLGSQRVKPNGRYFIPYLRDRHALAWADINHDGKLDIYITRGGVGGTLRILPGVIRELIHDELLLADEQHYLDVIVEAGMAKKDCSGRHAEWVDFDHDGRLDLFVNCQDRGKSKGVFPKQLWRQLPDGRFQDVATEARLALHDHEIIDFVWMDADNDGDVDLLTSEDKGFFLYRNKGGTFTREEIFRPGFVRADVSGLKSEVNNYWRFDGKLTVADFDADGDLDVFSSSKRGNILLVNDGYTLRHVAPSSLGLPESSLLAIWVDYDNDSLTDLYTVPEGLYRQKGKGRFVATGLLALPQRRYQAAVAHWYDRDNDGRRDLLLALNENPSLWRWWQKPFKNRDDQYVWSIHALRNLGTSNNWLQIEVVGPDGNRQAIGARVTVATANSTQVQEVGINDSSFFSQGHYRLYYGLGPYQRASRVSVRWPDGRVIEVVDVAANRILTMQYPKGATKESP